jgi:isopenicillin-N N-acyltransferase-like protein
MSEPRLHRSPPAAPGDRGREFGAANEEAVANTLSAYRRLFVASQGLDPSAIRAAGARVRVSVAREHPELAEEIEGLAVGAGVQRDELFAANARTELLAGSLRGECSTVALRGVGAPVLMQNWDWHPDLAASRVVWIVERADGGWFATFTEAGLLAKIGLNSDGLGLCLNILATNADGDLSGLPIHLVLRLVLDRCGSVDDVRKLLQGISIGASSCLTVMAADGEVGVFECRPGGPPLEPRVGPRWTAHTNHFLAELPGTLVDTLRADWPDTERRLGRATATLAGLASEANARALLRDHNDGPISVCCHDGANPDHLERQETLASVVMHPGRLSMAVAWGQPCANALKPVALPEPARSP